MSTKDRIGTGSMILLSPLLVLPALVFGFLWCLGWAGEQFGRAVESIYQRCRRGD